MVLYLPAEETLFSPDLGVYCSFAIEALRIGPGGAERVARVSDVSPDEALAALIACRCTAGQLDPAQLMDVVEDMI